MGPDISIAEAISATELGLAHSVSYPKSHITMATVPEREAVKKLLSKTVATICQEMIGFRSKLSIDGLLSIVVDDSKVLNVCIKEKINREGTSSEEERTQSADHQVEHKKLLPEDATVRIPQMILARPESISQSRDALHPTETHLYGPSVEKGSAAGPGPGQSDRDGLCKGADKCVVKDFGSAFVASVANMAEAVSKISKKPCCSGSAHDIVQLVEITNSSGTPVVSSAAGVPVPASSWKQRQAINATGRPEDAQWTIRLPSSTESSQAGRPYGSPNRSMVDSKFSSTTASTQSTVTTLSSADSPGMRGSTSRPHRGAETDDEDEDMLCEMGEDCCRLPCTEVPKATMVKQETLSPTNSTEVCSSGMDLRMGVTAQSGLSVGPTRVGPYSSSEVGWRQVTVVEPISCNSTGCTGSCTCCNNLAWMRHRDAVRTRRCRAKRGLPVSDMKADQPPPLLTPEDSAKLCHQSCACCQILQLRRSNARIRRKMYYQKKRTGETAGDLELRKPDILAAAKVDDLGHRSVTTLDVVDLGRGSVSPVRVTDMEHTLLTAAAALDDHEHPAAPTKKDRKPAVLESNSTGPSMQEHVVSSDMSPRKEKS